MSPVPIRCLLAKLPLRFLTMIHSMAFVTVSKRERVSFISAQSFHWPCQLAAIHSHLNLKASWFSELNSD